MDRCSEGSCWTGGRPTGNKGRLVPICGLNVPALEPAHALAQVMKLAPTMDKDQIIVMNLCGRGDKDIFTVGKILGMGL